MRREGDLISTLRPLLFGVSAVTIASCGSATLAPSPEAIPSVRAEPLAGSARYAYVSDTFAGRVYVYAWSIPGMKRGAYIRSLRLSEPLGGCSDDRGDVYIANFNAHGSDNGEIVEYRGDSSRRLRRLLDPGNVPFSCAVDPKTGDIAVANLEAARTGGGGGSVFVYPRGKGHGIRFDDLPSDAGALQAIYFVAYDDSGKLYADGSVAPCLSFADCGPGGDAHIDMMASCCSASSAFVPVTLKGDPLLGILYPGVLIWDGKHLDVGDREAAPGISGPNCINQSRGCGALYVAREGGSPSAPTLTETGLSLLNSSQQAWGVALADSLAVVPNMFPSVPSAAEVYKYPAGGVPIAGWLALGSAQTPAFATISR